MTPAGLVALGLVATFTLPAAAQQVYRSVGPDGRPIFTDVPPPQASARTGAAATEAPGSQSAAAVAVPTRSLPFALRQVVERFPVVLHTGPQCLPCDQGRTLLATRGIPFAERTVSTEQDAQALQRLSSDRGLPLLTIGGQHLKGFSGSEWNQYLDAAGYPKTSSLPANWQAPPPQALAPRTVPAAVAPAQAAAEAGATPAPPAAPRATAPATQPAPRGSASNPAGIQF